MEKTANKPTYDEAWWSPRKQKGDIYKHLSSTVEWLTQTGASRLTDYLAYARLYTNRYLLNLMGDKYSSVNIRESKLTFNVIQSVINTASAKISKNKVRPLFLTKGGDYVQRKKAKDLQKYIDGQFYHLNYYAKAQMCFRDCGIFGNGYLKFYIENDRICSERVFPGNVFVDDYDARMGMPQNLYEIRDVPREVLEYIYKDDPDALIAIKKAASNYQPKVNSDIELVRMIEAYHLPSEKGADDGRHVVCLDTGDISVKPWKIPNFPYAIMRWDDPILGFYGQGLAEILMYRQFDINRTVNRIQKCIHRMANSVIFLERGSKVDKNAITNEVGQIIEYTGKAPEARQFPSVPPELFRHLQWLIDKAYEEVGLSGLSARSLLPPNLESRVAMREYNDIETERQVLIGQKWENMALESAKIITQLSRVLAQDGVNLKILCKDDKDLEEIEWKNIDLEEDDFVMQLWPTSMFSSTPAAKLDDIIKLYGTGVYDVQTFRKLMDFPDVESENKRLNASSDILDKIIDKIIYNAEYTPPEAYFDLDLAIKKAGMAYQLGKIENVPEENLAQIRDFITACLGLKAKAQAPTAPQGQLQNSNVGPQPPMAPQMMAPGAVQTP